MATNTLKEAALEYAKRGWAVFPLKPLSKIPMIEGGFKAASKDVLQIEEWWTRWPKANIGVATGSTSGIVVLDIDNKKGVDGWASFHQAAPADYKPMCQVLTPSGGAHIYFKHPGGTIPNKAGVMPGLDVRGDGGYVVAPPSKDESCRQYKVCLDGPVEDIPGWAAGVVLPQERKATAASAPPQLSEGEKGSLSRSTMQFILEGAPPGTWHAAFYKAAIDLKQQGYSLDEAREKLSTVHTLDDTHDLPQLEDVYTKREPRHPPRVEMAPEANASVIEGEPVFLTAQGLLSKSIAYMSDKDKVKGLPTGLLGLDALLGGGARMGEVTAWHAEAKTGKNTLWHMLMYMWLEAGVPIGYASRELTPESEVLPNLLSIKCQENAWNAEMTPGRIERYKEAIRPWPLYFSNGYGYFSGQAITEWVDTLMTKGVRYFWIDHLHYCLEDPEDHKAASKLIKDIKTLAKNRDINIQIIIQPNKLMDGQKLSLNSIKGGAAMGQAIDNLLILERVKGEGAQPNCSKLTLDVARSKLAKPGHIFLEYNPETTEFKEADPVRVEAEPEGPTPYRLNRALAPQVEERSWPNGA